MNLGGLTWVTARRQVANHYATGGQQGLDLASEWGHGATTQWGAWCRSGDGPALAPRYVVHMR